MPDKIDAFNHLFPTQHRGICFVLFPYKYILLIPHKCVKMQFKSIFMIQPDAQTPVQYHAIFFSRNIMYLFLSALRTNFRFKNNCCSGKSLLEDFNDLYHQHKDEHCNCLYRLKT